VSRARNLTGFSDGDSNAEAAAPGRIRFPRLSTGSDGARSLWGLQGAHHQARAALKKTLCGACASEHNGWYDRTVRRVRDLSCGDTRIFLEFDVRRVLCRTCYTVKRELLDFLADNTHFTKRFAYFVGRRCRQATIRDVAQELNLDWHAVKELEKEYMALQLARAGTPAPKVIGIDEISIRKGHTYRIVVSDLIRGRPIWFGGTDRSEASMSAFYDWLGPKKSEGIRLAVMDMWKPFRKVTAERAPKAAILFDKFHIMRHLGEALDSVRKSEYARLSGRQRRFIKGQKYTLLSRRENLSLSGKQALVTLLKANKRLNTAYVLKESFGQLWAYEREGWARKFFENWRASLKWQRLKSYEKFAEMIDRHWDGIAAYCKPENKVSLGFVEGLNTKIRVIQRRAYGLRDEEYLRLKILTCMLPEL
jgi:transposase